MSIEETASEIAGEIRKDIRRTLHVWLGYDPRLHELLLEELVDNAMFHVTHLLICQACDEQRGKIDHE